MKLNLPRVLFEKAASVQFSRYLIVGATSWVVDFGTFVLFHSIIGIVWAQTTARIVGAIVAFLGHKLFVYNSNSFNKCELSKQIAGYLFLWCFTYLLSIGCILLLAEVIGLNPVLAKLGTEIILISINYTTMKRLIFPS
ncbi:MAG: GtrA family protein [Candidatus Thiodiazotropha sp.]|jgi:putative flippase GtrA